MNRYLLRVFIPAFIAILFFEYAGRTFHLYGEELLGGGHANPIFFIPFAIVMVGLPLFLRYRCAFPALAILYLGILTLLEYFAPAQGWLFDMLCFMTSEMPIFLTVMLWGWIAQHTDIKKAYVYYFPLIIISFIFSFGFIDYALPKYPDFWPMLICAIAGFVPLVIHEPETNDTSHGLLSPIILVIFLALSTAFVVFGGMAATSTITRTYPSNEYSIFLSIFSPYLSLAILAVFPIFAVVAYGFLRTSGWRIVTIASVILFYIVAAFLFTERTVGPITAPFLSSSLSLMRKFLFFPLIQVMIVHVCIKWRFMAQVIFGWLLLPLFALLASFEGNSDSFASGVLSFTTAVVTIAAIYFFRPSEKAIK